MKAWHVVTLAASGIIAGLIISHGSLNGQRYQIAVGMRDVAVIDSRTGDIWTFADGKPEFVGSINP